MKLLTIILFLIVTQVNAQKGNVYIITDSVTAITINRDMIVVNKNLIIVSRDYMPILLEPKDGKTYEWTITVKEHVDVPAQVKDSAMVDGRESVFTGLNWTHTSGDIKWYNKTISFNNTINATIEYEFTGHRIKWFAERKSTTHGKAEIVIDGQVVGVVDLRNGDQAMDVQTKKPIFDSRKFDAVSKKLIDLTEGRHKITIKILEPRYIVHDAFEVTFLK